MTTDWTTIGYAESCDDSDDFTHDAVRVSLLPHNTRRCLVTPILLTSNNTKMGAFVTQPGGLCSVTLQCDDAAPSSAKQANLCTDFILSGWTTHDDESITSLGRALLARDRKSGSGSAVVLVSDHSRCTHFVTNGKCSAPLTNADVLWMEKIAGCKPGTLFRRFREQEADTTLAPCELPWEPALRYRALSSAKALRVPKGHKTPEHMEHLRRSDPLINLWAWHDWRALHEDVAVSTAARAHKQAVIERARRAFRAQRQAQLKEYDEPAPWAVPPSRVANSNALKRAMHLDRLQTVDDVKRGERHSSDTIMAHLDMPPFDGASPPASPPFTPSTVSTATPPYTPDAHQVKWQKTGVWPAAPLSPHAAAFTPERTSGVPAATKFGVVDYTASYTAGSLYGERSPMSVVDIGPQPLPPRRQGDHFEKAFPPLPPAEAAADTGKAVDRALHNYKIAGSSPALWYSDS